MTIPASTARVSYPGTGTTGPFAYAYRIFAAADLKVTKRQVTRAEVLLNYPVDFAISGAVAGNTGINDVAGGNVTPTVAIATGETLVIRRSTVLGQPIDIRNQGPYFAATHEDEFDRLASQILALQDQADRSFGISETFDPAAYNLRVAPGVAGQVLSWASGTQLTSSNVSVGATVLPGQGRTVQSLSSYLANGSLFNAKDYGAVADGLSHPLSGYFATLAAAQLVYPAAIALTDEIDLVASLLAVSQAGTYGAGYAPAGNFVYNRTFTIAKWQSWIGQYNATTLTFAHNGDGIVIAEVGPAGPGQRKCVVANFYLINAVGNTPSALIANYTNNTRLENLFMAGATFTVGIENRTGYNLQLNKVVFGFCTGIAVRMRHSTGDTPYWTYSPSITGLDISNHTGDGLVYEAGHGAIHDSVIESCTGDGIKTRAAAIGAHRSLIHIDACHFEGNTGQAINDVGASGAMTGKVTASLFVDGVAASRTTFNDNWTLESCTGNPGNTILGSGVVRLRGCYAMSIGLPLNVTVKANDRTIAKDGTISEPFQNLLNVNGSYGGGVALVMVSHSIGVGNATNCELFLIRYGFDGNNFEVGSVLRLGNVNDGRTFIWSVDASGYLRCVASNTGNIKYLVVANMSTFGENNY